MPSDSERLSEAKPLLTRREIESDLSIDDGGTKLYTEPTFTAAINTITTMAELLERWQNSQAPTTRMLISRQELESLWMETNQIVQTFNTTGGEGA